MLNTLNINFNKAFIKFILTLEIKIVTMHDFIVGRYFNISKTQKVSNFNLLNKITFIIQLPIAENN